MAGLVLVYSADDPVPEKPLVAAAVSWQSSANCLGVDPGLFFPERGESTREAKAVCDGCSVRVECLDFALDASEKFGIWGGMSERERRRLRRTRHQTVRQAEIGSLPPLAAVPEPDGGSDDVAAL